jgi:beta-mannanase
MQEYEAVAQNAPVIVHLYKKGAVKFPTASDIALSERPGKQRSLLLINWKPSTSLTWRQIADGGADAAIATVASGLKAYDHRLFVTVWHEPENDVKGVGSGYTPADYVAMYRHVVLALRAAGVTNAVYVMNYMGFQNWAGMVDSLYPGDDVVDWIAYDPYGEAGATDYAQLLDRTTKAGWPGFYTWATTKAPGKPIMLAEWGFSLNSQPNAPAALDGGVEILRDHFPMLKAVVYWNNYFAGGFQVRLDQPSDLGRAYGAAYQRFANDPYFNSTSTAAAD